MSVMPDHGWGRRATYQILNSLEQLHKDLTGLGLTELVLGDDPVEQFALRGKLKDQIYAVAFIERVLETENIGM